MYLCLSKTEVIKDLVIVKPYIWGDWLRNPAKIKGKNYSAENRSKFRYANTGLIPPAKWRKKKSMTVRRLRMLAAFRQATCDQVLLNSILF